ncbi:MAG TPA: hypothetical protein VHG28_17525 [Longimicrobiaceae bacterium]|nr:hypothetical protein [Longimicrobiaceae bacterium]
MEAEFLSAPAPRVVHRSSAMYRFPHEIAYLSQTKLSYVNLPGLLSDGKRDRTARVPGFVAVQLGERCYLIFIQDGDPFHAGRVDPAGRRQVALAEVLRIASTESERGENGQIGFFGAPEGQLRAMLATLLHDPVRCEEVARPGHLFPALREQCFSGVVELYVGGAFQYLAFQDGTCRAGYLCERDPSVPVGECIRALFQAAGPDLRVTLFPPLADLPVQAGPGLADLYRRIIGGILREVSAPVGREAGLELMRCAHQVVAARRPALAALDLTDEGRVRGYPVATPGDLTEAVADWVTEALIAAADQYAVDPGEVVERVARDSRFVLAEQGFFARLPWAVAF